MAVRRINHAVLYVVDAARSAVFYVDHLGFEVAASMAGGRAVFLRAPGSGNDHDLGLFSIGAAAGSGSDVGVGLYHLAWQVDTIEELARLRGVLLAAGSLVGESDHGASKSLYARDLDGIEFEVMWAVPPEHWPPAGEMFTRRLDLAAELARWAGVETR